MRFVTEPPPASRASAPGPASLAFVSPRVGFAATTGGMHFVPREGWVQPRDSGRIERTDDGGVSWRTLWSGPRVVFDSIAVLGRTVVAGGGLARRVCCSDQIPVGRRFLVVSADGGRTWRRRVAPRGGGAPQLLTPRIWIVAQPLDYGAYPPRPAAAFRTSDAGRHWRRLTLPQRAQVIRFVTPRVGFAGARGRACPRRSQLWRTSDGGTTWRPVPRTCGKPLADLDVVSARVLLTAQADPPWTERPRSVVRRSTDGGRSWRVAWRQPHARIERLAFVDARRGFAVETKVPAGGRTMFTRLRVTTDGRRTWRPRPLPYTRYPYESASTYGPVAPTAFVGMRHAWGGDPGVGLVWRTSDGARTWRLSADPLTLSPEEPTLVRRPGTISLVTAAGVVATRDGGRTWALSRLPSAATRWPPGPTIALAERRGAYLAEGTIHTDSGPLEDFAVPMVTPDGGRTWRRVRLPRALQAARLGAGDVAFTSARDGLVAGDATDPHLPVYATHDGGRTWRVVPTPGRGGLWPGTAVVLGPGVIVVAPGSRLLVTTNEGRSWHSFAVASDAFFCGVWRPTDTDLWLACTDLAPRNRFVLLSSHDGGRTWIRRTSRRPLDAEKVVAIDGREAWMADRPLPRAVGAFWHTTDGGATWHRVWISLCPGDRVVQVTSR
jgi:photosystem II stability/assembly factor-like uncharacterized protein